MLVDTPNITAVLTTAQVTNLNASLLAGLNTTQVAALSTGAPKPIAMMAYLNT